MRRIVLRLLGATLAVGLAAVLFRSSGTFLVVDNREKSDAIVVTQGDSLDARYWTGLHLLTGGYGRELLINARTDRIFFGRNQAEWTDEFIRKTAASAAGHVRVCPITADTTAEETFEAGNCLKRDGVRSALLVVEDFHSRRSLAMFSRLLPQYRWSITAVSDPLRFGRQWWRKREWIRTTAVEWQHLLWWEMIDRWRFAPQIAI